MGEFNTMRSVFPSSRTISLLLGLACAPVVTAAPQLIKIANTGEPGRITFANVARPNSHKSTLLQANPVIQGNNLYAPDMVRVGDHWHCYHGGWLTTGQPSDRVYVGISTGTDPTGPWVPASQVVIYEGIYLHVNDPSVVIHDGTWYMMYTAFRMVGSQARDWINYSTSADGINWTPSVGTASTEIVLTDPNNIAGGPITDMARPSLVRTPTRWEMWFDAQVDNGGLMSYLAHSTAATPNNFTLVHRYPQVSNFPGFYEPDVVRRPDGSYLAVVQRYFRDLFVATSENGIDFNFTPDISALNPLFGREKISNPGLIYDQTNDRLLGLGFGMTDSPTLVGHDIGFSVAQYTVSVRSPGAVWHNLAQATGESDQLVQTENSTSFDLVRITDPMTGAIVLQQSFSNASVGDLWHVQWNSDAPVLAMIQPNPDIARTRTVYTRDVALIAGTLPVTWTLVAAPVGATIDSLGTVSGWVPRHDDYGKLFSFEAKAENAGGAHSRRWQVQVLRGMPDFDGDSDVDQTDFGYFQKCLTSNGVAQDDPACEGMDFDYDKDVDTLDLADFVGCLSGPGTSADLTCLD